MFGALDSTDEVIGGKNEDVGNGVVIKNRFGRHVVFSPFLCTVRDFTVCFNQSVSPKEPATCCYGWEYKGRSECACYF